MRFAGSKMSSAAQQVWGRTGAGAGMSTGVLRGPQAVDAGFAARPLVQPAPATEAASASADLQFLPHAVQSLPNQVCALRKGYQDQDQDQYTLPREELAHPTVRPPPPPPPPRGRILGRYLVQPSLTT